MNYTIQLTTKESSAEDLRRRAITVTRSLVTLPSKNHEHSVERLLKKFTNAIPRLATSTFPRISNEIVICPQQATTPAASLLKNWTKTACQCRPPLIIRSSDEGMPTIRPFTERCHHCNEWDALPLRTLLMMTFDSSEDGDGRVWKFRPRLNMLELVDPIPMKRTGHSLIWVKDGVYVVGGYHPNKPSCRTSSFYWNSTNEQWFIIRGPKFKRRNCAAVNMKSTLYTVGGTDPMTNDTVTTIEYYDSSYDIWLSGISQPNLKNKNISSTALHNRLWILSSTTGSSTSIPSVYYWDLRQPRLMLESRLPQNRSEPILFTARNRLYVGGGESKSILKYDERNKQWEELPVLLRQQRFNGQAISLDEHILFVGGRNANGKPLKNVEIYNMKYQNSTLVSSLLPSNSAVMGESSFIPLITKLPSKYNS